MASSFGGKVWAVSKVLLARLRFLAVFVIAAGVVGYWDNIKAYVDRWQRPAVAPDALAATTSDIEYYCAMHPAVVRTEPGDCPICGMPLIKRKRGEKVVLSEGIVARVQLTPQRIALANIQTTLLTPQKLTREIRAVGILDYNETRVAQISGRVAGRADELFVKYVGQSVKRGDPLYSLYSPELLTAQREYLLARKRVNELPKDATQDVRMDAAEVYNASMEKLVLWGTTSADLDRLDQEFDKTGQSPTHFVVSAPISGIVARKNLYEGGYVQVGDSPYTVVDLNVLWLQVRIYEQDVPLVKLGDLVNIGVDGLPNETFTGKITFLAYQLDPTTRTLAARVEVPNPGLRLRPGMFASGTIRVPVLPETEPAGTQPAGVASGDQAAAFRDALAEYFAAHDLLAQDKTEKVSELLHAVAGKLAKIHGDADASRSMGEITRLIHGTMGQNLVQLRDSFQDISAEMIKLGLNVGIPTDGPGVNVFRCPMGRKPMWLQIGSTALNPYQGTAMPTCGGVVEPLPRVAAPVATRPAGSATRMLAVPRSAVIETGKQKVVFVANPTMEGVFDMKPVKVGALATALEKDGQSDGDYYPVVAGLEAGDRVVTIGAFLLDAENRLNPVTESEPAK